MNTSIFCRSIPLAEKGREGLGFIFGKLSPLHRMVKRKFWRGQGRGASALFSCDRQESRDSVCESGLPFTVPCAMQRLFCLLQSSSQACGQKNPRQSSPPPAPPFVSLFCLFSPPLLSPSPSPSGSPSLCSPLTDSPSPKAPGSHLTPSIFIVEKKGRVGRGL